MKKILTIAGSDSGGGAGIQADLKTITVLGGYGMSVITALTAQNTQGVRGVLEASPEFIKLQMDTVLSDIGADAAKTGMLASSEIVRTVAQGVRDHNIKTLVVDPVMVAASGDPLLAEDAVDSVKTDLLPLAHTVTPNLSEASILCGFNVDSPGTMKKAAQTIHTMGPRHVLIKGGHLEGTAMDLFYDGIEFTTFESPRIDTVHTHGTGCTLSAALATFLGQGFVPLDAMSKAKRFITRAIAGGLNVGRGKGPTNPYVEIERLLERETVLAKMTSALERLLSKPYGRLIPEIRSNLGYAVIGAESRDDVAAVPGRITQINERVVAFSQPAFGASSHVAKVVLAAMRFDPQCRSAMAVRYEPEILQACQKAGFVLAQFDRADEPKDLKEKEGSSLEWGTRTAIKALGKVPDAVWDEGEKGKEPVIRILGPNPEAVIDKLDKIFQNL
jgi:hydroxymethylpyrimidine kinase/phosphomethylpyrimidine kinase